MDIIFKCTRCEQELSVDESGASSEIQCPSCGETLVVPPPQFKNPIATSAAAREERHFAVPQHERAPNTLIEKPHPPLEVAAKISDRQLRVKSIRRSDCVEVGKDHFDETVNQFLLKVGETNVVSIETFNYTHMDLATRAWITDYGVLVVYKG